MPRSRFLRIALLALFFAGLLYPAASLASGISTVKNAISSLDKSMTLGKALDSYQYFEKGSWEQKTTERGQEYVEFRAYYKNDILVRHGLKGLQAAVSDFQNYADPFIAYLNKSPFRLEFKAQFMLSADKKEFTPAFIGFEDESSATQQTMERRMEAIYKNAPFSYVPTEAFRYYFKRYVLQTIGVKPFKFAKVISTGLGQDDSPIALFQLQSVAFDDANLSMEAVVEYEITDITKNRGHVQASVNDPLALYAEIAPRKGSHAVLQKGTMRLQSRKDDTEYNTWAFSSQDTTGRNSFIFDVHALNPLRTSRLAATVGSLSEQVQSFVGTQKQALVEKEKADRERAQTEQQAAYEQSGTAQVSAARSAPYKPIPGVTGIGAKPTGPIVENKGSTPKPQPVKAQAPKMVTEELWLRSVKGTSPDVTLDMCINETDACDTFIIKKGTPPYKLYVQNKAIFQNGLIFKAEYDVQSGVIGLIRDLEAPNTPAAAETTQLQKFMLCTGKGQSPAEACKQLSQNKGILLILGDGGITGTDDPTGIFGADAAEYKIEMFGGFITLLESETERQIDHLQQEGDYLISQENGKLYKFVQ